jgi:hypothetical protein
MSKEYCSWKKSIAKNCNDKIIDKELYTAVGGLVSTGEKKFIKMSVTVYKANYGHYLYWNIECNPPVKKSNTFEHPFRLVDSSINNDLVCEVDGVDIDWVGEIVADNEMVRKMLEFLTMPDEELMKYTGNTTPIEYRSRIIKSISLLWD